MKIYDQGILSTSDIYFHTPRENARNLFFYLVCTGHYFCDTTYIVNRKSYNSFLTIYIKKGSGFICLGEKMVEVQEGNLILLDCYQKHCYGTQTGWEIIWAHFDGRMARDYFNAITPPGSGKVLTPRDLQGAQHGLTKIFDMFHHASDQRHTISEPLINKYIIHTLTEFMKSDATETDSQTGITEDLLAFIAENIDQPLPLEALAKRAALSPYYFSRIFKKETGYSPHEYVLLARTNAAKFYLKTTDLLSRDIALRCGFSNECSFCTAFKRITGVTPLAYRSSEIL